MSWVEVPDGVKMPETTTYKRWKKRRDAQLKSWVDANKQADNSPEYKYNRAMQRYNAERKRLKRVNTFRQKHGKAPLAMPKRPEKASFGLKGGKKPSTGKSSG